MVEKKVGIEVLMASSGVKFGTSGARGLVKDMTDEVCYAYTVGFIQYLEKTGELSGKGTISVAGDLRASTDRIMNAVFQAIADRGYTPHNAGKLPSPAVAYYGLVKQIPTVMVTGSHIPEDRNGIKYTKKAGEILKKDEAGMRAEQVTIPEGLFDEDGALLKEPLKITTDASAEDLYVRRYLDCFDKNCLAGKKIGVYLHSAVGRDIVVKILAALGAEVTPLERTDSFIPVDTEAIRPEDIESAKEWARDNAFDAIVSTDGDSDRPLVGDENGQWLRGDVAGILTAAYLGAEAVATPVSCNTAVEKSGLFERVVRTRIGSPYVIEAMQNAEREGASRVIGYEANGGFLIQSPIPMSGGTLAPLPTRDAVIVHLAILSLAADKGKKVSEILAELPQRFTASDRLKEFPTDKSKTKIQELYSGDDAKDKPAIAAAFGGQFGEVQNIDATDGVRITFANSEIVHLRPSGNAPEFRCYAEADTDVRAREINKLCLETMAGWR